MRLTRMVVLVLTLMTSATAAFGDQAKPGPLAVGDPFPRLDGSFLTGRKAVLPDVAAGKFALLMMGFTYDSRYQVEAWSEAFRHEFGANPAATFYQVPVLGGMARMGRWFIDSGMRRGTPKELHENVITVYGGAGDWKKVMGFEEAHKNEAYLALLDPEGRVRWLHRGALGEEAMAEVRAVIDGR